MALQQLDGVGRELGCVATGGGRRLFGEAAGEGLDVAGAPAQMARLDLRFHVATLHGDDAHAGTGTLVAIEERDEALLALLSTNPLRTSDLGY